MQRVEEADRGALILIEEIENGLHPVATRLLVDYLIDVAKRKAVQIIFTTHSDAAIAGLPDDAIWACVDGQLSQGRLQVSALRALTGEVEVGAALFVEILSVRPCWKVPLGPIVSGMMAFLLRE